MVEIPFLSDQPGGDRVVISALGRTHLGATDFWDGNWVTCSIDLRVGSFSAAIGADLRADELGAFRSELEDVYERLTGTARLISMEHWITLDVRAQSRGHFTVEGEVRDSAGRGNVLTFAFETEQSFLRGAVEALQEFGVTFPIVGRE